MRGRVRRGGGGGGGGSRGRRGERQRPRDAEAGEEVDKVASGLESGGKDPLLLLSPRGSSELEDGSLQGAEGRLLLILLLLLLLLLSRRRCCCCCCWLRRRGERRRRRRGERRTLLRRIDERRRRLWLSRLCFLSAVFLVDFLSQGQEEVVLIVVVASAGEVGCFFGVERVDRKRLSNLGVDRCEKRETPSLFLLLLLPRGKSSARRAFSGRCG